jgi:uncharacterized protein (TIGR04222 family)
MDALGFFPIYLVLAAALAGGAAVYRLIRRGTAGAPPPLPADDPYRIAFLRDGRQGLVHAAVVALFSRGLIQVDGDKLAATGTAAERGAEPPPDLAPLEAEAWRRLARPATVKEMVASRTGAAACERYRQELEAAGFVPSAREERAAARLAVSVGGVLALVVAGRVAVGLARGDRNLLAFGFIGLTIAAAVMGLFLWRQTARGKKALRDVQRSLRHLRAKRRTLRPGDTDVPLFVAAFGPRPLPQAFADVRDLVAPRPEGGGD